MPARWLRPRCSHVFTLLTVVFLVPACVQAQTGAGSVTLTSSVSKTVALSVAPGFPGGDIDASVVSSGGSVRLTMSSTDAAAAVIHVPLLVRSNSGFKISAAFESGTAELAQLAVTAVRATGKWVSPHVVNALQTTNGPSPSMLVITGPRVSLGGTLDSPQNALQITLLIRLKQDRPGRGWVVHLTFVGTAE
jgi:hypothetical protein